MKNLSSQSGRQAVLIRVSSLVHGLGGYPFFGTALGIIRNGEVLDNDDDVDFIIPVSSRKRLEEYLQKEPGVKFTFVTEWIIQVSWRVSKERILADFYFFWEDEDDVRLLWNFFGTPWRPKTHLLVPKSHLREIHYSSVKGFLVDGSTLASYLYGPRWQEPMRKNIDYEIRLKKNRPTYTYPRAIGRFARARVVSLEDENSWSTVLRRRFWMLVILNPKGFVQAVLSHRTNRKQEAIMKASSIRLVKSWNSDETEG